MALSVRKLRPADDRSAFKSGDPDLDRFFKRFAGQNQFKHYVGTTYVAEDDGCLLGALLKAMLILARAMASDFGCIGIVVDAKPQAIAFYRRYGFTELDVVQGKLGDRPEPVPMFLAIGAIPATADEPLER